MSQISSTTSAISQETIAALQAQMAHYTRAANGQNGQTTVDYKALQAAIKADNVSDAQVALALLQHDSQTADTTPTPAQLSPTATSPVDTDGGPAGSAGTAKPWGAGAINVTA